MRKQEETLNMYYIICILGGYNNFEYVFIYKSTTIFV